MLFAPNKKTSAPTCGFELRDERPELSMAAPNVNRTVGLKECGGERNSLANLCRHRRPIRIAIKEIKVAVRAPVPLFPARHTGSRNAVRRVSHHGIDLPEHPKNFTAIA